MGLSYLCCDLVALTCVWFTFLGFSPDQIMAWCLGAIVCLSRSYTTLESLVLSSFYCTSFHSSNSLFCSQIAWNLYGFIQKFHAAEVLLESAKHSDKDQIDDPWVLPDLSQQVNRINKSSNHAKNATWRRGTNSSKQRFGFF